MGESRFELMNLLNLRFDSFYALCVCVMVTFGDHAIETMISESSFSEKSFSPLCLSSKLFQLCTYMASAKIGSKRTKILKFSQTHFHMDGCHQHDLDTFNCLHSAHWRELKLMNNTFWKFSEASQMEWILSFEASRCERQKDIEVSLLLFGIFGSFPFTPMFVLLLHTLQLLLTCMHPEFSKVIT